MYSVFIMNPTGYWCSARVFEVFGANKGLSTILQNPFLNIKNICHTKYHLTTKIGETQKRKKNALFQKALSRAFEKTKESRESFTETKFAKTTEGKTIPVEYQYRGGAEVSVDFPHEKKGPDCDHIGWQTVGKRSNNGGERGHILLDFVPAGRNDKKE